MYACVNSNHNSLNTNMKNAHQTYTGRREAIDEKITKLQQLLRDLDARETNDSSNWGFAGSAGAASEKLDELISHFTGEEN